MASGTPARALVEPAGGAAAGAGRSMASRGTHLAGDSRVAVEMALEAKGCIALGEHFLVHRAVGAVTGSAPFLDRIVCEDEGSHLCLVALRTGFIPAVKLRATTLDRVSFVRVMALGAGHLARENRVTEGQAELGLGIEVALEAGFRRFARVDDGACGPARLLMLAARAMAGFTSHVHGIFPFGLEFGVICCAEIPDNLLMALGATFSSDETGPRDADRCHHGPRGGSTGNENEGHRCGTSADPHQVALDAADRSVEQWGYRKIPTGFHGVLWMG